MIRLNYSVIYPKVDRVYNPEAERELRGVLPLDNDSIPREQVCDILFAGFGNHPGNEQDMGFPGYRFTTGNATIDMAHRRWSMASVRSMSVGDVVHFENSETYYICDSCGWMAVGEVTAKSWLNWPREYGCCSFELRAFKKAFALDHNTLS